MRRSDRRSITYGRQMEVMQAANDLRAIQVGPDRPFDPILFINQTLPKIEPRFEFFVGDEFFPDMPRVLARVQFGKKKQMFLREHVYRNAVTDDASSKFVVCHEIGHIILHSRRAKALARNAVGSPEQYRTDTALEREASIFAGSLLVPTVQLNPTLTTGEISRQFATSLSVAEIAVKEADQFRTYQELVRHRDGKI